MTFRRLNDYRQGRVEKTRGYFIRSINKEHTDQDTDENYSTDYVTDAGEEFEWKSKRVRVIDRD